MFPSRVNITECEGWTATFYVPEAEAREHLPIGYEPRFFGAATQVMQRADVCRLVSVDGLDEGFASLEYVSIAIQNPSGAEGPTGLRSHYLLEFATDDEALGAWLTKVGVQSRVGNVSRIVTPLAQDLLQHLTGTVSIDGSTAYQLEGLKQQDDVLVVRGPERFFFGPEPSLDHLHAELESQQSRAQWGWLSVAPGTAAANLLPGASGTIVGLESVTTTYRTLERPAA